MARTMGYDSSPILAASTWRDRWDLLVNVWLGVVTTETVDQI
jgi:hypothetical protein